MSYRSEANRIGNKQNYKDLNMSHYPNQLDTRNNNTNMRGFINVGEGHIPDYVMADYVNALNDSVMSIQRTLGRTPMVPFDTPSGSVNNTIESSTVADRLNRIEDGLFDERYGGSGWRNISTRPTLSSHNHDGANGHPARIHLVNEITGRLNKANINLTASSGLTGADIFVSRDNQIKINEAINDSLSKSEGGTVQGDTHFRAGFSSRTRLDMTASELALLTGVSRASDSTASSGRTLRVSGSSSTVDVARVRGAEKNHMLYGRYVIGLRVKTNSNGNTNSNILRFVLGNQQQTVRGTEIGSGWTQVYWAYTHDSSNRNSDLRIQKLATSNTVTIDIDNVFIEPIHPAVLDR